MAGFAHLVKSLLIPLFLALILYIVLAWVVLPFVRRHRSRYAQYLPMPTGVTEHTASWRTRISDALANLFLPSSWAARRQLLVDGSGGEHADDDVFDDEEGEGMVGFEPVDGRRRREALERRRSEADEETRLGRDLEEGFRDESSDEEDEDEDTRRRRSLSASR